MSGWIAIHRGSLEHELFERAPVTEWEAWARLIARAAWKKTTHRIRGNVHDVERGSFYCTLRELQAEFMWGSPNRVERFLKMLSERNMAEVSRETAKTYITICNYDKYQSNENGDGTANGTAVDTATEQPRNTKGTSKQINKKQKGAGAPAVRLEKFDEFWSAYPDGNYTANKDACRKKYLKAVKDGSAEADIISAVRAYARSEGVAKGFTQNPGNWLSAKGWKADNARTPSAVKATAPDETLLHFEAEREKHNAERKAKRSGGPRYTIGDPSLQAASRV